MSLLCKISKHTFYVIYVKKIFPAMVADIMSKITVKTKEISQYIYVHTYVNECSDFSIEVKLPALLGKTDGQTGS